MGRKPPEPGKRSAATSAGGFKVPQLPKKKRKPTGARGHRLKVGAICGAKKRTGGHCQRAAGWGTSHPGIGKCKSHGGATVNHVKAAASDEYRTLLGVPYEINPYDALLWCIKIRAGEIKWLSDRMKELDDKHWIEDTMMGKQFHLYARERQAAMRDMARYTQMAISLGIAERAVKLAETYAEMLAAYTQGILQDLWPHLNDEGRAKAPMIVRQHLIALDGGKEPTQPLALPETAAA